MSNYDSIVEINSLLDEEERQRKRRNLKKAEALLDDSWTKHGPHHWSRTLLGNKLQYWPSVRKWYWRKKTYTGDVYEFIKNRENDCK